MLVDVIIPALNEENAIAKVLDAVPREHVRRIIVSDNGSTDRTGEVAKAHGAEVVFEAERGYGAACLKAMAHIEASPPDAIVFLDGDYSDHPEEMPRLIEALRDHDVVIGSRVRGKLEPGALTVQQRVGNAIACIALRKLYGAHYTDLGPFRAVRYDALQRLKLRDRNWGFTVELQIKAAKLKMRTTEVPVSYRPRIGVSKVSGTLRGTLGASRKILWLLARHTWR